MALCIFGSLVEGPLEVPIFETPTQLRSVAALPATHRQAYGP